MGWFNHQRVNHVQNRMKHMKTRNLKPSSPGARRHRPIPQCLGFVVSCCVGCWNMHRLVDRDLKQLYQSSGLVVFFLSGIHSNKGVGLQNLKPSRWWFQNVSNIFFTPIWGRWTHFDEHIFQRGWNHHLVFVDLGILCCSSFSDRDMFFEQLECWTQQMFGFSQ